MKIYVEPTDPNKMLLIGKILDKRGFRWGNTLASIFGGSDLYKRYFCTRPFGDRLCIEIVPNKRNIYTSWIMSRPPANVLSDEQFLQKFKNDLFILNGGDM